VPLEGLVALAGGGAFKAETAMGQTNVIASVELAEAIYAVFQFLQNKESGQISPRRIS
jgi:hypothetical protein